MRIIAGRFGGRPLKTLPGKITRPTSDKVKGAIYSMIGPFFNGGRVLDLYAGSGGLSIEAISRGMTEAVLVEKDPRAQAIIADNIKITKSQGQFYLIKKKAQQALRLLTGPFDLVFLDPPYTEEEIVQNILSLEKLNLLSEDVMIVCETDKAVVLPQNIGQFYTWKQKIYGISKVTIYVR
ncbi:16S rRNA (guanine(966)-N(2))-methyltransferase RsmD [Streptococcus dentasini]